jgi:hypothetical protein
MCFISITACNSNPPVPATGCPVDFSLIQDIPFPARPPGGITNGWLLETLRTLRVETQRDAARKAELVKQLEVCAKGTP